MKLFEQSESVVFTYSISNCQQLPKRNSVLNCNHQQGCEGNIQERQQYPNEKQITLYSKSFGWIKYIDQTKITWNNNIVEIYRYTQSIRLLQWCSFLYINYQPTLPFSMFPTTKVRNRNNFPKSPSWKRHRKTSAQQAKRTISNLTNLEENYRKTELALKQQGQVSEQILQ